jgi:hypothetical protein
MLARLASSKEAVADGGLALGLLSLAALQRGGPVGMEPIAVASSEVPPANSDAALPETGQSAVAAPPAAEVERKRAELRALEGRIERLRRQMWRAALVRQLRLARLLGVAGFRITRSDAGLRAEVDWVVGDRWLTALLSGLADLLVDGAGPRTQEDEDAMKRWELLDDLMDQRDQLESELDQLGAPDLGIGAPVTNEAPPAIQSAPSPLDQP